MQASVSGITSNEMIFFPFFGVFSTTDKQHPATQMDSPISTGFDHCEQEITKRTPKSESETESILALFWTSPVNILVYDIHLGLDLLRGLFDTALF